MLPRLLILVFSLSLCACASTPQPPAPAVIPPPVATLTRCLMPDDLPDLATANELTKFALGWLEYGACEHAKRIALLRAWPQ